VSSVCNVWVQSWSYCHWNLTIWHLLISSFPPMAFNKDSHCCMLCCIVSWMLLVWSAMMRPWESSTNAWMLVMVVFLLMGAVS
jgi:hypothetical protein